jgi:two-component system, sensor histidine kinase
VDPSHPNPGRRVLVVDDNPDAADALATLLRGWGHDTRAAYGGEAGLRAAREFRPDVCLLDLGMPGLSGFELAERLRREPVTAGAVLVAVSGWGEPETRRRAREAEFDHFLLKPSNLQILRAILAGQACGSDEPPVPAGGAPVL